MSRSVLSASLSLLGFFFGALVGALIGLTAAGLLGPSCVEGACGYVGLLAWSPLGAMTGVAIGAALGLRLRADDGRSELARRGYMP